VETAKGWTTVRISMTTFKLLERLKEDINSSHALDLSFDKILYMLLCHFSKERVLILKCKRCGHIWVSKTNLKYVTCPSCQRKVNVKRELVKRE